MHDRGLYLCERLLRIVETEAFAIDMLLEAVLGPFGCISMSTSIRRTFRAL